MRDSYLVRAAGREQRVTRAELKDLRGLCIGSDPLGERIAGLFWLDLFILDAWSGVDPMQVLDSIKGLEGRRGSAGLKPASRFNQPPLRGLWHKHYFSAQFLVDNIILGLGKNGLERRVQEVLDPSKSDVITREMINELTHRVTTEPFEERAAKEKLTGEWVVYLPRSDGNRYLCCGRHDDGDLAIYDRILTHCTDEFPELALWIAEAAVS